MGNISKNLLKFDNINTDKDINEEDKIFIEMKILNLLVKRTERYTMGDSTSIPIETAEELLKSIWFSIGLALNKSRNPIEVLLKGDLNELLKNSWSTIESMIYESKKLLELIKENSLHIENISYNDTLKDIEEFFKNYDYRFFAHRITCIMDYQLSNPVFESLQGIEYIKEYLKCLLTENEFCMHFDRDNIIDILNSYCNDYKGLLINIFEPLLTNVIALDILEGDIFTLEITAKQRNILIRILKGLTKAQVLEKLEHSVRHVCKILEINDDEQIEYIFKSAINLYPRIEIGLSTGNLENVFLSFKHEEDEQETVFIDNDVMEDEKLQNLIKEIKDCRFVSDKIAIVKEEIKSVRDLVEILNECFWEDEALELFKTFSVEEIYLLKYYLYKKDEKYMSDSAWEITFKDYIREIQK